MLPSSSMVIETFLKRSSIFVSVEEYNQYKKLWPSKSVVEAFVESQVNSVQGHHYHLGLDISSRSTGICVLSDQGTNRCIFEPKGQVLACKATKPDHSCKGNSILSANAILQSIQSIIDKIDPDTTQWNVAIEKYLQMFGSNTFRTQSLFFLAEINGIVQFRMWEKFGRQPMCVHPSTARSVLSLKSAGNREDTKEAVFAYVRDKVGDQVQWPQKKRSSGFADECYDMADAYVLAQFGRIQDRVQSLRSFTGMKDDCSSFLQSPLFLSYFKTNLAHHLRKYYLDDSMSSLTTVPEELLLVWIFSYRDV